MRFRRLKWTFSHHEVRQWVGVIRANVSGAGWLRITTLVRLARFAELASFAEVTFIPVLHEASQPEAAQSRPQSLRYPYPAERATDALGSLWKNPNPEAQNPGSGLIAPASNCLLIWPKQVAHWYILDPKQFFFFTWPFIDVFTEESSTEGLFNETGNNVYLFKMPRLNHLLVMTTHILPCSEWAQLYAYLKGSLYKRHKKGFRK